MKTFLAFLIVVARIFISAIFIWAGFGKIFYFHETAEFMRSKGMVWVPLFLIGSLLIELVGGFAILLGYYARIGAMVLFLFLVPTTFIFHDFWNASELEMQRQMMLFLRNINILGGLLYVTAFGSGRWSIDWSLA